MMLTQERQSLIEDYVNQHELCRVSELCDLTATSESTIRRDLIQMEKMGSLSVFMAVPNQLSIFLEMYHKTFASV